MTETAFRIFRDYCQGPRLRAPRASEPSLVEAPAHRAPRASSPHDLRLVAIVTSAVDGVSVDAAFRAKEDQLRQLFCALSPADARGLLERLDRKRSDALADEATTAFGRLAIERRSRLLAVLRRVARCEGE